MDDTKLYELEMSQMLEAEFDRQIEFEDEEHEERERQEKKEF